MRLRAEAQAALASGVVLVVQARAALERAGRVVSERPETIAEKKKASH